MRRWFAAFLTLVVALGVVVVSAGGAAAAPTYDFTVVFKADGLPANAPDLIRAAGGQVTLSLPEIGVLEVNGPADLLETLGTNPAVQAVSPVLIQRVGPARVVEFSEGDLTGESVVPDLYDRYQWDIKQVTDNGASWALDRGSHNTVVGIIDTGVNPNHPALKANFLGGRNFVPAGANGDPTETGDPNDYVDRHGHGSHVAGTIAGNGRILGVGPDLGFRSYRVFGASGGAPTDWIVAGMIAAVKDKVDVISMSIGGYDTMAHWYWTDPATGITYRGQDVADFLAWRRAVQYAVDNGVVVVAAAGNAAIDIRNPATVTAYLNAEYGPYGFTFVGASREVPGTTPGVVTVSATGPDHSLASYSNYGAGAIDVSAPGGDFKRYPQMTPTPWYWDMCLSAYKTNGYVWMAGTSMATPKASAVAALIIDQAKAGGQTLTPAQVVNQLEQTAVDLGKPAYDGFYGHGQVSAYNALSGR